MRPVAVYSALRVGLFLVAMLTLRFLGVSGLLSVVIALVLAMLLSFLILRRQRDAVTRALMERRGTPRPRRRTISQRLADDAAIEDAATDHGRPAGGPSS